MTKSIARELVGDKTIICVRCGQPFVFTYAEQTEFAGFGFDPPKRCPECRLRRSRSYELQPKPNSRPGKRRDRHRKTFRRF